jgi:tetratricopeptide (TPR) repeat protein
MPWTGSADEAFARVAELVGNGSLAQARDLLDDVAAQHTRRSPLDSAKALRLGAGVSRLLADPHGQLDRGERAVRLAATIPDGGADVLAAARIEVGEAQLALGNGEAAAKAFESLATGTGRTPAERFAAKLRQAGALGAAGRLDEAVHILREAAADAMEVGEESAHVYVYGAALAQAGDRPDLLATLESAARTTATTAGNPAALADLDLLAAARALGRGDLPATRKAADTARAHARQAVHPLAYLAAVLTGSRVADRMGDRLDAYRLLATGYVTLADLLGKDVARTTFEPELLALRDEWGADEFAKVKAQHDAARRKARAHTQADPPGHDVRR